MKKEREKAVFNWSGGKDSALALYKILQAGEYEVIALLTTINRDNQRSSMHAIPVALLQKQAASIGIPLYMVDLESKSGITSYEEGMTKAVYHFKKAGVKNFIFGDIFLHDVKSYREKQLQPHGIKVVEPLWGKTSEEIMAEFLASGLQTVVVTITADVLNPSFIGRLIDTTFPGDLPEGTDVCGENGEYHTFCYAGGMFRTPVSFSLGQPLKMTYPITLDDGTTKEYSYWFANLQDGI